MMKSGASKLDQSAIRQFANNDKSAEWISNKMQIPLKCVIGFMPGALKVAKMSPQQKGANTRKAAAAKAAEEFNADEVTAA